ncbi:MAG TPA: twin transmembrane helix small protein [Pseudomonas xinjiangensis]|uniref:Twin transmembrane helix small protein n=2 Tax=root TaxID=1 RepID=A0A7V1BRP9_9GAMM|nr:twin transmembrane helix small protein [Halopseudomonas xinjiangensis]HEC48994.1 twin transmembrane helix small protein [Halopseudomonas xinjiangensis]
MWLKLAILVLLAALVTSLFSGLFFLMKDTGSSNRLVHALTVRIALTVALMGLIAFGFWSGQLGWNTPWLQ